MKIFLDYLKTDNEEILYDDFSDDVVHEVTCMYEGCNGKVNFLSRQIDEGSASVCNKCNRSIIMKLSEV